ncbi:MAG TPA: hypothetical protein VFE58_01025 [Tepidisphaeraceae bacterium]|jgi:hypothetical protein|nr:hypothetical protein [Tepidisphaeraceae bacterium]
MLIEENERAKRERRRSQRWACSKTIHWRVRGGRRIRESLVPERSLDGLVISAERRDLVPLGTRIQPCDLDTEVRHGFRDAVVCRTADDGEKNYLLYIDILY